MNNDNKQEEQWLLARAKTVCDVSCLYQLRIKVERKEMDACTCACARCRLTKWRFFVFRFRGRRRSRPSLDFVLLVSRGQQTQLHIIACFASFESSRQFSLFIIVSIFSISVKKSLDSHEYLNFAAFSDEAN